MPNRDRSGPTFERERRSPVVCHDTGKQPVSNSLQGPVRSFKRTVDGHWLAPVSRKQIPMRSLPRTMDRLSTPNWRNRLTAPYPTACTSISHTKRPSWLTRAARHRDVGLTAAVADIELDGLGVARRREPEHMSPKVTTVTISFEERGKSLKSLHLGPQERDVRTC